MKSILIAIAAPRHAYRQRWSYYTGILCFYSHPAMVKEDWWHLLKVGSEKVMIDEDTMVIMRIWNVNGATKPNPMSF